MFPERVAGRIAPFAAVALLAYALSVAIGPALGAATWKRTLVSLAVAAVTGISVKRLVDELRATRDGFGGVLRAATEYSIIASDPDGLITVFNAGAEQMLGYRADQMVGKRTLETVHLDSEVSDVAHRFGIEPGVDVFVEAARYGIPDTREWTYVRSDGSHVPVSATVTAMRDERGKLAGYIVIAANITGRRMERARTEAIIASQTDIAMAGHDTDTVMNRIVARAVTLTGASGASVEIAEGDEMVSALATGSLEPFARLRIARVGSLSGLCLADDRILYCEDSEHDLRVDRETCRRVGARSMVVVPLHQQTASPTVLKVVSPLPHGFTESDVETLELLANLMGAAIAHAEDYARVAEANSRLRDLDRLKDEFVATVSHELRTPLSSIIAYAEMLTDGDAGRLTAQQAKMIFGVERNSRRSARADRGPAHDQPDRSRRVPPHPREDRCSAAG